MYNSITNGVTINTGTEEIHSWKDLKLVIGNNNIIGAPEVSKYFVSIPGMSGMLDLSETLTGRPIYISRPINIKFGGIERIDLWDTVITKLRNKIHGRIVKLIFDNDPGHYWTGRAELTDFDRVRELGYFTISIPKADPYKYEVYGSMDDWLWDPFDFEEGVIRYIGTLVIEDSINLLIPRGDMLTVPIFNAKDIETQYGMTVEYNGKIYNLQNGRNRFPQILIGGPDEVLLILRGKGQVDIDYRGGSL